MVNRAHRHSRDTVSTDTIADPEKHNISGAENKDIRIPIINIFKDLKEELSKPIDEIHKTQTGIK